MTNISHAHDRIPTNDPKLWAFIATLLLLSLTAKLDAEHVSIALQGAGAVLQAAHLLRRNA
ncbi:hypothetical protein [Streptomyces sp. WAC08241]|uniref:hypothetical protein n=1 Tax=Streptomyces sp. WAC08241 TaxID=2487421 RepID=UPI000F768B4E|nr:hypothetical protein [Streptomyces sp. WAC08241]RSS37446.1 hypothetical protein EF906_23000 [Streptomyces sp. WAC08241]